MTTLDDLRLELKHLVDYTPPALVDAQAQWERYINHAAQLVTGLLPAYAVYSATHNGSTYEVELDGPVAAIDYVKVSQGATLYFLRPLHRAGPGFAADSHYHLDYEADAQRLLATTNLSGNFTVEIGYWRAARWMAAANTVITFPEHLKPLVLHYAAVFCTLAYIAYYQNQASSSYPTYTYAWPQQLIAALRNHWSAADRLRAQALATALREPGAKRIYD